MNATVRMARALLLFAVFSAPSAVATAGEEAASPFIRARSTATYGPPLGEWFFKHKGLRRGVTNAVTRGVDWLVSQQNPDGSWIAPDRAKNAHIGCSALAVTALMDAGHSYPDDSLAGKAVRLGVDHLVSLQDPEGCIGIRRAGRYIFSHAFAAHAIVRAYRQTRLLKLGRAAQRALDFTALARNPRSAWRYGIKPGDNDTAVTGAMLLAYEVATEVNQAAERAGLSPPLRIDKSYIEGASAWMGKVTDKDYGKVGYLYRGSFSNRYADVNLDKFPADQTESMTATGIFVRLLLGENPRKSKVIQLGLELIKKRPAVWNTDDGSIDQYYWWWAAMAIHRLDKFREAVGSFTFDRTAVPLSSLSMDPWRKALVKTLLGAQIAGTNAANDGGSWAPEGAWGKLGGRVYSTALAVSSLQLVAYRANGPKSSAKAFVKLLKNRDADVEKRLLALERVGAGAHKDVPKAVASLLEDPTPIIRLGAAEALARLGKEASSVRSTIAKRLAGQQYAEVRQAIVFALLRIGRGSKTIAEVLDSALNDTDAGVRFLARQVTTALGDGAEATSARKLCDMPSAHELLALAEEQGRLDLPDREMRIAVVRWTLLRDVGLPRIVDGRIGHRVPLVPSAILNQEGVLEAVEAALAIATNKPGLRYADVIKGYDEAIAKVASAEVPEADQAKQVFLAAVIELHHVMRPYYVVLDRGHMKPKDVGAEDSRRLNQRIVEVNAAAPKVSGDEVRYQTARLIVLTARRSILTRCLKAPVADLAALARDYEAAVRRSSPNLAPWMQLERAAILEMKARLSGNLSDYAAATNLAAAIVDSPHSGSTRPRLRAAALYFGLLASQGLDRRVKEVGLPPLPAKARKEAKSEDGIQIELLDVNFRVTWRRGVIVRVRATSQPGETLDRLTERRRNVHEQLIVECQDAMGKRLGIETVSRMSSRKKKKDGSESGVAVFVLSGAKPRAIVTLKVGRGSAYDRPYEIVEVVLSERVQLLDSMHQKEWYGVALRTLGQLEAVVPHIEQSLEGISTLCCLANMHSEAGEKDAAIATAKRALAAAESLGHKSSIVVARRMLRYVESK